MRASVTVEIPELVLQVINKQQVAREIAESIRASMLRRTGAGVDATGVPLPRPEAGNPPLNRTGRLLSQVKVRATKRGVATVAVRGDRKRIMGYLAASDPARGRVITASLQERDAAVIVAQRLIKAILAARDEVRGE